MGYLAFTEKYFITINLNFMKHKFFIYPAIVSLSMLCSAYAIAQDTTFKSLPEVKVTASSKVTRDVSKSFKSTFPYATQEVWYKMDKNYLAKFLTGDQSNQALFDKYGSLIYHIRYGKEANLPDDIRDKIKADYKGYDITSVIFVTQEDRRLWLVNIENSSQYLVLRSEEGELQQVDSFNKGKM